MSQYRFLRIGLLGAGIVLGRIAGAQAATYTFDSQADLSGNFDVDVTFGDFGTQWRPGYGASGGFPGSDGGFVSSASGGAVNSLEFKSGPVFLNSFQISSQYNA